MCRETVKTIRKKSAEQALSSLMRQCARAEKSTGDAMRLMARWGVEPQQRAAVLQRLVDEKFIDNSRYAQAYVREKVNLSGWGERKIASSLRAKGISSDIIAQVVGDLDRDSMAERLEQKIKRKVATTKYKDLYDLKGKLIRYGLGQGYPYEMVGDAVSKIIKIEDE